MQERDKGSKWLIGFHADALVRLAGIRRIASWKAVPAEPAAIAGRPRVWPVSSWRGPSD